jgi:hypothetical protein
MAEARMHFVRVARDRIIERGVDDNESWQKARQLYGHLLGAQFWSVAAASNWIGGAYVNKYRKGDPGATDPITPVEVEHQRRALQFVIDNALRDSTTRSATTHTGLTRSCCASSPSTSGTTRDTTPRRTTRSTIRCWRCSR